MAESGAGSRLFAVQGGATLEDSQRRRDSFESQISQAEDGSGCSPKAPPAAVFDEPVPVLATQSIATPSKYSVARSRLVTFKAAVTTRQTAKIIAVNVGVMLAGWSDGSTGTLIPLLEKYYEVSYLTISLLFIGQAVGFLVAALANTHLTGAIGFGKVIVFAGTCQLVAFGSLASRAPYPVVICLYAVNGFGLALIDAQANAYLAGLPNVPYQMGVLHGVYGLGALLAPIAGTAFAKSGVSFFWFYLTSTGFCVVFLIVAVLAFRLQPEVDSAVVTGVTPGDIELEARYPHPPEPTGERTSQQDDATLKEVLRSRVVWYLCLWLVMYVGVEVTLGGWIPSFLASKRGGGTDSGLVATGFWAGIMLSRFITPPLNVWFGEKRIIYVYLAIATAMELIVWLVPNLVANSVCLAVVGLCLGPFYPIAMSVATKILKRQLHASAIGFCAAGGQLGAALFPFITGALAQKYDLWVLQPVVLSLLALIGGIWLLVPTPSRRIE